MGQPAEINGIREWMIQMIAHLVIDDAARGKGIGRAMLAYVEQL